MYISQQDAWQSQETRVNYTAQKINIEWLMPILNAYAPSPEDIFPNVKVPDFYNNMSNITQAATDLKAVEGINSKFHWKPTYKNENIWYLTIWHSQNADTNGFSKYSEHISDSVFWGGDKPY